MKFLREYTQIEAAELYAKQIKSHCQPYLKLLKENNVPPFLRGMDLEQYVGEKEVRKNRATVLHAGKAGDDAVKYLNQWLQDNGGARRDRSVIATSDYNWANDQFGDVFFIFPMSNFKYSYIKAQDLNVSNDLGFQISKFDKKALQREDLNKYFVNNKDIKKAYTKQWEIWFECDDYFYWYTSFQKQIFNDMLRETIGLILR